MLSAVERGEAPLSPGLAARLLEEFARQAERKEPDVSPDREEPSTGTLTERQTEVLNRRYDLQGSGAALGLSERTVKYHMERILKLLHLENRAQAIAHVGRESSNSAGK